MTSLNLPLHATAATREALAEARAVAILVGSYDGSGNYGDIAQLDAGLRLLGPLEKDLLILPMLERAHLQDHRNLLETFRHPPEHAVFFDPERSGDDDLLPLAVPPTLFAGAIYLYGGGYLNPFWGERKLAMMRVAEDLFVAASITDVSRLASGLQVDRDWLEALPPEDAELLGSFELLGARDPLSAEALATLGSTADVVDTGDDALGDIPFVALTRDEPGGVEELEVNLHFGGHEWMSGRPDKLLDLTLDFISELSDRSGLPVRARPLIAYLDGRIDERPQTEALVIEAGRRGITMGEPLVLRPASLPSVLPELKSAVATISGSYHVAMTSLLLGIPTVFFADNSYYEQKAAGLLAAFGLPPTFALSAGADPVPVASTILESNGTLHDGIARHAEGLRRVRAAAETEVLGRLAGGVAAQLATAGRRLEQRVRESSTEPAQLRIELASLQTQVEELRRPAIDLAIQVAERRAVEAEQRVLVAEDQTRQSEAEIVAAHERLAEMFGSRSWRVMEPIRRIGRTLRRLGRRGGSS